MIENNVKRLREEKGWGIKQLARNTAPGITSATLRRVEKGHACQIATASQIVRALDLVWPDDERVVFPLGYATSLMKEAPGQSTGVDTTDDQAEENN